MEKKIAVLREKNDIFSKVQKLMGITPLQNKELQELEVKYNDRKLLWTHVGKFITLQESLEKSNIRNFNAEEVDKEVRGF
jgi:hypothetical protein